MNRKSIVNKLQLVKVVHSERLPVDFQGSNRSRTIQVWFIIGFLNLSAKGAMRRIQFIVYSNKTNYSFFCRKNPEKRFPVVFTSSETSDYK